MSQTPVAWACRITPEGRGAIAVIRVWGEDAVQVVDRAFRVSQGPSIAQTADGRLRFGRIGPGIGDESVAVILSRNPPEVEIHGHGGSAVTSITLAALAHEGAKVVASEAAVRRVSLEQQAENVLAACSTIRTAEILLDQVQGALRRDLDAIRGELAGGAGTILLDALISRGEVGVRLVRGWSVVLTGRPNVGKSRLLNRLAGFDRAIVSELAGTTRDVVTLRTAFEGWPVELADTAGLHESLDPLEVAGMGLARDRLDEADLVVIVFDQSAPLVAEDDEFAGRWPGALVVANKCDLPAGWTRDRPDILRVSAVTGEGIERLAGEIARRLVIDPPGAGRGVPFCEEILLRLLRIREAIGSGDRELARVLLGELLV